MKLSEKILIAALALAVLNTGYLSYRFIALRTGVAAPGTGLCSLTESVDCDRVLLTREARAFYFPNALLGFGFFFGCLVWWLAGKRLPETYRKHLSLTLTVWLGVAMLMTFWFFWLLIHLPHFCPLCPWNHLLTYIAFGASLKTHLSAPHPSKEKLSAPKLAGLIATGTAPFFIILAIWYIAFSGGLIK
ncbi:MAG: vitamin K epoxide reductase family protein [Pyrinomonadaceae bacterium]